jgi:hypothetical protein
MNFLIIILNRVYLLLTKVKNQSPLFGSAMLVAILFSFSLLNIIGLYYSFKIDPFIINFPLYFSLAFIIFILLFYYAKKNKSLIIERDIPSPKTKNLVVALFYLAVVILMIYLANINAKKISKQTKNELNVKPRKESLEGVIKKWLMNKD